LMNAQANAAQRLMDQFGLRQSLLEIAAALPEDINFTLPGGMDHLSGAQALPRWRLEAPHVRASESAGVFLAYGRPHHVGSRHAAHFRPALHAAVAADGHESGVRAAYVAARQLEVDQGTHVVAAIAVLRDAHAPDHHRAASLAKRLRKALHVGAGEAGAAFQFFPGKAPR